MKTKIVSKFILSIVIYTIVTLNVKAQSFTENFDDITTLTGSGWFMQNNSIPLGVKDWFQGTNIAATGPFDSYNGAANSYIAANYNNTSGGTGGINNWLLTPNRTFRNGDVFTFYSSKATPDNYPDRLEVRLSSNGVSTNVGSDATSVGDFTTLLLSINPTLVTGVYPTTWTLYTITISGLPAPTSGRIAFRYFVSNAGPSGTNSDYIGIDNVVYTPYVCPVLSITPTTLSNGTAGIAYSQNMFQTGALGTPSYAVTAGALPPGLSLSSIGELSGIPIATGTFNFTVTVSDASGCSGSQSYSLTITCPLNGASLSISPSIVCSNAGLVTISGGSPLGGTYSGVGVSDSQFDSSIGSQEIIYTLVDEYGCTHQATDEIIVNDPPTVTAVSDATENKICAGGSVLLAGRGADVYQWNNDVTDSISFSPSNTLTYEVIGTDTITGCSSVGSITLTVNELPAVSLPEFVGSIYTDSGIITLTEGTPTGGVFSGTGVTGNSFDPSIGIGSYPITYTVTDLNGCVNSDAKNLDVLVKTGIKYTSVLNDILVYPNPSFGKFNITYNQANNGELGIRIYNLLGREVVKEELYNFSGTYNKEFNIDSLEKGIYLIEITSNNNKITNKLIIE